MTVSTEISSNEYTGNGVTTDFDYKFRIFKANQLSVITSDADGDNVVTLRLGTDYTVTGANKSAGGKVILTKPLANGHKISIARDIPITQETSFRNQSKFFAETHEDAFDYLTMIIQRIWGSLGSLYLKRPNILANWFDAKGYRIANLGKPKRDSDAVDLGTLKDEISGVNSTILKRERRLLRVDDMDITALPKASERAGNVLTFDKDGRPIVVAPASGSAVDVLNQLASNDGISLIGSANYHELREYRGNATKIVIYGRQHIFDNAAGEFSLDLEDTTSLDNDGTVLIDALNRRWKRSNFFEADVRWWGVVGDGVHDDTIALKNAIHSYPTLIAWSEAQILLTRQYDDGTAPSIQFDSYCIQVKSSCDLNLNGGTIVRGKIGDGDDISMYQAFKTRQRKVYFKLRNGTIDMNNHNARFAEFYQCREGSGIFNCEFINTRNNGTPRTKLANSSELVTIKDTTLVGVDNCTFYVGSDGDRTGNATKSYDNPSFAVRIVSKFVTVESEQTENTAQCFITNSKGYGPFTWQTFEIAGTGTRRCYMDNILLYKPVVSMIDLDKGCKSCWANNVTIQFPDLGIVGATDGGDGMVIIRFQGYSVGGKTVYAEDCYASNITIYNPQFPNDATVGMLVESNWAKRCSVNGVRVIGGRIPVLAGTSDATDANDLILNDINGEFNYISRGSSPKFKLNNPILRLNRTLVVSTAYLSNEVDIDIYGFNITSTSGAVTFLTMFENTGKQAKLKFRNGSFSGFYRMVNSTGSETQSYVYFIDVNSMQEVTSTFGTIPTKNIINSIEIT
ncbi:hypothetical protein AB7222_02720 [Providencia rettgeri]